MAMTLLLCLSNFQDSWPFGGGGGGGYAFSFPNYPCNTCDQRQICFLKV